MDMMKLAPCGLDCNACKLRPKECDGCHATSDHVWCGDCAIRLCCISRKKMDNCSVCDEFPCQAVLEFEADTYKHHAAAVRHLREMRGNA
ncbi:MAG: DUF3795 domain-containing protein [Phycisphaerae bacterium]|nr:DUF3795 domain-containing protein [Phycisphaerae bacterium]